MIGSVLWFDAKKGFGFLKPDNYFETRGVYFDWREIQTEDRMLVTGQRVEFFLETNCDKPYAKQVSPI